MKVVCDVQDSELMSIRSRLEPHLSKSAELIFRQSAAKDSWFFSLGDVDRKLFLTLSWPGNREKALVVLARIIEEVCSAQGWSLRETT